MSCFTKIPNVDPIFRSQEESSFGHRRIGDVEVRHELLESERKWQAIDLIALSNLESESHATQNRNYLNRFACRDSAATRHPLASTWVNYYADLSLALAALSVDCSQLAFHQRFGIDDTFSQSA